MQKYLPFLSAIVFCLCAPAYAAQSDWVEIAPDTQLRVISAGKVTETGQELALELKMPQSNNTYWQVPGEAGIPTQISVTMAGSAQDIQVHWPQPTRETKNGLTDYVYRGDLVLPFTVQTKALGVAEVSVLMGICSDICVPAQTALSIELSEKSDPGNGLRIKQAMAYVPRQVEMGQSAIKKVMMSADRGGVQIVFDPDDIDPNSIIARDIGGVMLFGAPEFTAPDAMNLPLIFQAKDTDPTGEPIAVSYMSTKGAFEVQTPLEPKDSIQ